MSKRDTHMCLTIMTHDPMYRMWHQVHWMHLYGHTVAP